MSGSELWTKKVELMHTHLKKVDILISKNQALQILYLKHHDNVYKTS